MIVYDQDRVFVVDENFGNIVLVPRFEEYVKKVGFSVRLCRPHDPQSKGKVETFVRYIKESFLAGRIYKGIDSLNSDALRWLDAEGNGTTNLRTRKPPRVKFREEARHRVQFSDEGFSEIRSVSDKYTVKIDWIVYELPRTAVKPFEQVRVEEQDGMLLFYKAAENELIHKLGELELHKAKQQRSVTATDYAAQIKEYSERIQALEAQQAELQSTENRYSEVKMWLDSFAEHIQSGGIMNADDGMIMKQLVEQIIINDDGIEVHFKCGIVASHKYL